MTKTQECSLSRRVELSERFTITISFSDVGGLHVEWEPSAPQRPLTKSEMGRYRQARDEMIAEWSKRTGVRVAVVEA